MNREKVLEYQKKYNQANKDKIKEYNNQYYIKHHPDKVNYNKTPSEDKVERRKQYQKEYQKTYRIEYRKRKKEEKMKALIEAVNNPIEVYNNTLIDDNNNGIFMGFKMDKKGLFYLEW